MRDSQEHDQEPTWWSAVWTLFCLIAVLWAATSFFLIWLTASEFLRCFKSGC